MRRIIVFVVNSLPSPPTNWDESEKPPGTVDILLKATGVPIDHAQEHFEHEHYTLHVLLGHSISDLSIDAPRSFQLVFDSGHRLTIYDDNEHYETFSVNPAGQAGVYI